MGPLEQEMANLRERVLKRLDNHFKNYPIGERYFGQVAVKQTYIVERLRNGGRSKPETYYKLLAFMDEREARIDADRGAS